MNKIGLILWHLRFEMHLNTVVGIKHIKLLNYHLLFVYLIVSSCFSFVGVNLYSQQQYSKFGHITIDDGLSSNRVRCIYRDSKDYLWIGTEEGLDKYNSYEITKYHFEENKPGSISSNNNLCIYEDREKNLWFGTVNGLNLFNPVKDNFKVFKNITGDTNSLNSNYVGGIIEDKDGNLWILAGENCLNKWVSKTQSFIRYQFESEKVYINPRPAKMIAIDSKGYLWIVSFSRGILRFDTESGTFTRFEDPAVDFGDNCFKSLYIDNQDKIWVATDGYGFFSYDPAANKFEQFGSKGDGKGTNQKIILDILPEDEQHLLLAVDQGGINRFDKISETFEYFKYDNTNEEGLNNNGLWCLYRDNEGILWIGTSGGGINYYNPKKSKFKLFRYKGNNSNSISYNNVTCFYEDHQNLIWIGTDGGGVNVFDPETGRFRVFKHEPSNSYSISGNAILSIVEDKDHDMWIGTWDAGLNRYDRKTERFFHYMPDKNNPSSISGRSIWNLAIDKNDTLWSGEFNVGTELFDKNKGVIRRFRSDTADPKTISGKRNWILFKDKENNVWISTTTGLNLYDNKTNSFKKFTYGNNVIEAFCKDRNGNLWLGSAAVGILFCKPDGTIQNTYNLSNGLSSIIIQAIIEDNSGNIWISSNGGISRFDRKTQKFRNYSKEDGLQGEQFKQQSFLITRKGEIYFGGYNGFNSFYPDSLKDNDFIPPVYLTDFQIFNKPVDYGFHGAQFQTHINEAKEITLNWQQSVFSFSFAAINYTFPEKNQYAYMMEGFEKEWNYTNASRRYVTYTNLNPGEYTFRVKASNNDEIWNDKGVSLHIIILPPWWNTWWFKLLIVSAIILIFVSLFLSRIGKLKNQKILLEKSVALKTIELQEKNDILLDQAEELNKSNISLEVHQLQIENQREELLSQKEALLEMNNELHELNASKDKFFSIIAHDLRGPLSAFVGVTQILTEDIMSMEKEEIQDVSINMKSSAENIYRLLENLLEWSRLMQGQMNFIPEKLNLKKSIEACIDVLSEYARKKRIEIAITIPDKMEVFADSHMFDTVIRNLVSNAIKFTSVGGKISVKADYCVSDHSIEVEIIDSGIGMTQELKDKLFLLNEKTSRKGTEGEPSTGLGLLLCKEFIEKHGGKIWVESKPDKGSTFKFLLPLNLNHFL